MPDVRLYYDSPPPEHVETEAIEQGETDGRPWVRLERTIFYPEGGGQPADRGTIAGVEVKDVQPRDDQILHFLERPVAVGPVEAVLDAARRLDYSQQHTAQHLVTAVLLTRHGLPTTAFHLGEEYSAIEVDGPVPPMERLLAWEDEVNDLIREDRPVTSEWADPADMERLGVRSRLLPEGLEGRIRLIRIEGVDLNTCGGTHVARLGELQLVHLFRVEAARGGTRIHYLAGGRVIERLRSANLIDAGLKDRLGTAPESFAEVIDAWQADKRRMRSRIKELEMENAGHLAREIAAEPGPYIERTIPGAGPDSLRFLAKAVLGRRPDVVVSLVGEGETTCFLVQSGPEGPEDVSAIGRDLQERLGAKGGGRGRTWQGRT
jgi:Ser-tRNA(Ala) deacylase AlaX